MTGLIEPPRRRGFLQRHFLLPQLERADSVVAGEAGGIRARRKGNNERGLSVFGVCNPRARTSPWPHTPPVGSGRFRTLNRDVVPSTWFNLFPRREEWPGSSRGIIPFTRGVSSVDDQRRDA